MTNKRNDPYFEREKEKYKNPIPSREYIMQVMDDEGRPLSLQKLYKKLGIKSESKQEALLFRLKAMLRDGQIMQDRRNRYCLLNRITLIKGTVQGHPDGFGFFIPDTDGDDMFLSAREMRSVMNGDKVLAYQVGVDRRGRPEGRVHEVLEHANATVVGRFFCEQGVAFVEPDSKRLTQDISIPPEYIGGAKNGQIVLVEIIAYPRKRAQALGQVIQILGDHLAPGMETQVAIYAHGIPVDWPPEVLAEISNVPQSVHEDDLHNRKDLRSLPFVTIDGEDARDFDDAVYCCPKPKGGFQLFVAIADVSHYVRPGSALDKEASDRGNSTYFPSEVVPMLPEALSNGICSLNPKVDRLCMVAEMAVTASGKIARSRFYRAVIHSHARLTYTQVGNWLTREQCDADFESVWEPVQSLYALYQTLLATRKMRGAMEFETTETKIYFDEHRKIEKILPSIRNEAHKLIEECMLAANVATAKFLEKAEIPALYRVHEPPEDEKLTILRQFLAELGIRLGGGKKPGPKDFQKAIEQAEGRPDKNLIQTVMLRSLSQAHYVEMNEGHFGLAYGAYTHFTSPIRRYPDLLIHRAIGHILDNQPIKDFEYSHEDMSVLGRHCSMTERRSDEASRDVLAWLKCEYMQDKIGQRFAGHISSVTGFGIFVELDDVYVEGLVHITSLKSDYYQFDASKHRLTGTRGGKVYNLGDSIEVLVARVDLDERKIDFEPIEDEAGDD